MIPTTYMIVAAAEVPADLCWGFQDGIEYGDPDPYWVGLYGAKYCRDASSRQYGVWVGVDDPYGQDGLLVASDVIAAKAKEEALRQRRRAIWSMVLTWMPLVAAVSLGILLLMLPQL